MIKKKIQTFTKQKEMHKLKRTNLEGGGGGMREIIELIDMYTVL